MKYKWIVVICVLALALCVTGCEKNEETTLTGMVISVDGTVISLQEMDSNMQGNFGGDRPVMPENGEMPSMPEGMEDFTMPEDFDPENFDGMMPEDFDPESFDGTMPEGTDIPERPTGGERPDFGSFGDQGEATQIDLANAHISVEIEGGKATGSMEDITAGVFVTITLNSDSEAINVVVSSRSGFTGRGFQNFG